MKGSFGSSRFELCCCDELLVVFWVVYRWRGEEMVPWKSIRKLMDCFALLESGNWKRRDLDKMSDREEVFERDWNGDSEDERMSIDGRCLSNLNGSDTSGGLIGAKAMKMRN